MKSPLTRSLAVCLLILSAQHTAWAGGVYFSEYVEGSSNNKALEIANDTGAIVDLSTYQVQYYFNGSTSPGTTISLTGTLAPGEVFVLAHASASSAILAVANQTNSSTWYNGNDAVVLRDNGVIVDSIGQIGVNPGTEWGSGTTGTADNTLRRKVCTGDSDAYDPFAPELEWDGFGIDVFSGLGAHTCGGGGGGGGDGTPAFIHEVQGSGASSPMVGARVMVEAIVVADFRSTLSGFYIQEEDADADADDATSEGIFVYGSGTAVSVGDLVSVTGTVNEYFGMTELGNVTVQVLSSGNPLPAPVDVYLPLAASDHLERYEGMRVRMPQPLTVTENYNLGRYGEVWLSSGGRLMQPTNIALPGPDAGAVQAANNLNRILLDDGSTVQNPDPIVYPAPVLSASNTLRSGDTTTGLLGVLEYRYGTYRVQPTVTPVWVPDNARQNAPNALGGSLRVASFNVLNYFNGDGNGGGFPTSRGANTLEEFDRQRTKIIAAITSMDADIIGLMEIENDGYGATSAIQDLVNGLNAAAPSGTSYAIINPGVTRIGTDEIAVGLIYRVETVAPVGSAAILTSSVDSRFDDTKNRPVLAQTFDEIATGGRLTVAVNHFKSKGSSCDAIGDPDTGDGQGNCNLTRTDAAAALADWLATDPTGSGDSNSLIIGDLNAYAKEDPITALKNRGYTDLIDSFVGAGNAYSYVFDGQSGYLDHALASTSLAGKVTGVTEWHINADEPRSLDYNVEFKTPGQRTSLYAPDAFRASDHDPVLIGLALTSGTPDAPPTVSVASPASGAQVSGTITIQVLASDGEDAAGTLTVQVAIGGGAWQTATYNSSTGYYERSWNTVGAANGGHTIRARATDSAGNTTNANNVHVTVQNRTLHVNDLDGGASLQGGNWIAKVTIGVEDDGWIPVSGATVTVDWVDSSTIGTLYCTTGSDGRCSVAVTRPKRESAITFTVDHINHSSMTYAATDNYDVEADSDGTSITVSKP
jgi:uncharacterized protein